jgi:multisubunit Na+/H+ antiporter MnhF subunit
MTPFELGLDILIGLLSLSLALCFVRLYRGPDVPNRTVAFDMIALHTVGLVALFAIRNGAPPLLDIMLVTAVLGFLGTVLLARYLEQGQLEE